MTTTIALDGKVALVTGGARGMGAAHARALANAGAKVVIADLLDADGEALAAQIGAGARYRRLDVSSAEAWQQAVAEIEAIESRLDVLVNNAGILITNAVVDTAAADFERMFRVNQLGTFLGMQAVQPLMARAGGGSIVNVSSVAGLRSFAHHVGYASTKWAVRGMTRVAAAEFAPQQIRVNSIHPGLISTPMIDALGDAGMQKAIELTPLGRAGRSDEVADLVLFLASDRSSYITGAEIAIDGGMTA